MKIIICIKPIKTEMVYPNEKRNEKFVINPYDLKALEGCLELKKTFACEVMVLTMGEAAAEEVLVRAIAMGADEGCLVSDRCFSGSDTVATTYILEKAIHKIGADLVVCGEHSIDGETGQVTYGVGERLKCGCLDHVVKIEAVMDNRLVVQRKTKGYLERIICQYPVVLGFTGFSMDHGKISLMTLKRARRKTFLRLGSNDLALDFQKCGLSGSKTKVLEIKNDLAKKQGCQIGGSPAEMAKELLTIV